MTPVIGIPRLFTRLIGILVLSLTHIALGVPGGDTNLLSESHRADKRLSKELTQRTGLPTLLQIVENYDLNWRSRLARNTALREDAFKKFVADKGLDPAAQSEQSLDELVIAYWQATGRVSPEMVAWRALEGNKPEWDRALPHYRTIIQARSHDVPPRILMILTTPRTSKETAQWFDIVKEAYALSASDNEKLLSAMSAAVMTIAVGTNSFATVTLKEFASWLQNLDGSNKSPEFWERIRLARALVATSKGDIDEALANAKDTPFFVLMPLFLMSKGQWERALETTREAKKYPNLSADDKTMLDTFENILKDLARPAEKAPSK